MDVKEFKENVVNPALTLLLNKSSLEFFGILSYGIRMGLIPPSPNMLGCTNGKNILMCTNDTFTPKSYSFVLCHELWHLVQMHVQRGEGLDPILWNVAIDSCTNYILNKYAETGLLNWPANEKGERSGILLEDYHSQNPKITPEELYDNLRKDQENQKPRYKIISVKELSQGSSPPQEGEGGSEEPEGNDEKDGEGDSKGTPKNKPSGRMVEITIQDTKTGKTFKGVAQIGQSQEELEEIKGVEQELKDKGSLLWNMDGGISKGDVPGDIAEQLNKLFEVKIPWEEILNKSLLYHAQTPQRLSWSARNIYMPGRVLPGKIYGEEHQLAVFVVDSSRSVDTEDLEKFISVVCSSTQHFKKIMVIIHDHNIQQTWEFIDRPDKNQVFEQISKIKGRGGTSHADPFKLLEELHEVENLSCVVFLTDYESDVESIYKDFQWIKEIPCMWVLNKEHPVNLDGVDYKVINI